MRHIRGLRDINTHGSLARAGRLVSVARDWHRIEKRGESSETASWNGRVDRTVFKRSLKARRPPRDLFQDLALEGKIRATQIALTQEYIVEMEMFASDGVPGALVELQRLKAKLLRLKSKNI